MLDSLRAWISSFAVSRDGKYFAAGGKKTLPVGRAPVASVWRKLFARPPPDRAHCHYLATRRPFRPLVCSDASKTVPGLFLHPGFNLAAQHAQKTKGR
ncbi:MAG: hypothetical protein M0Z84_07700 [Gammaproteobacteria bacterium]|nr:hypothetical protein [Gammaproteobacteria bacterium]